MKSALLAVLLMLAACDGTTAPSDYTDAVLTLLDAELPTDATTEDLAQSTITFAPDGTLTVASCNTCDGRYAWDDHRLRLSAFGCTEAACGDRFDLGLWFYADRIVVSDTDDDRVTLVAEQEGGEIATFLFRVTER